MPIVEIGLHHEQQHQELMLTDILHAFAQNPTDPAYDPTGSRRRAQGGSDYASICPPASAPIGFDGDGFCFDNEQPAHQVLLRDGRIARHLVTNGEWLEFMADGGYTHADPVAVGRLGRGRGARLERAGLLAQHRRRVVIR